MEQTTANWVPLVGPGGLLGGIIRTVLESALHTELDARMDGWCRSDPLGKVINRTGFREERSRRLTAHVMIRYIITMASS